MFYPKEITTEQQAKDWAFDPDWKPSPINETREEYDERLADEPIKMRDHHWGYYKWAESMSLMSGEERLQSWKDFQDEEPTL